MNNPEVDREYVEIYPVNWHLLDQNDVSSIFTGESYKGLNSIGLYIHVPFCPVLCPFCSFNRIPFKASIYTEYVAAMKKEISLFRGHPDLRDRSVNAIYVGGGTGSLLDPDDLDAILQLLGDFMAIDQECEVSVECHPSTVNLERLRRYRRIGVNRLSLGIQSFQEANLRVAGLIQTPALNKRILGEALTVGFNSVVMDLMYRFPDQGLQDLEVDLRAIEEIRPHGVSAYSLLVDETPMQEKRDRMASEDLDRTMFELVVSSLRAAGYERYMQPDYCLPGHAGKYILNAWKAPQQLLLGFGAGAQSHYFGGFVWTNVYPIESYLQAATAGRSPAVLGTKVSQEELMAKYVVLGVRHLQIPKDRFTDLFGVELAKHFGAQIGEACARGWLADGRNEYIVTKEGEYYIDNLSKLFYSNRNQGEGQPWVKKLHHYSPAEFQNRPG